MSLTTEQLASQLQKLLPPGALARGPLAIIGKLLLGTSEELARIEARLDTLLAEAHPATTTEMIEQWEAEYALPDPCVDGDQTLGERRAAILAKLNYFGGQPVNYFHQLANALGITITITEHRAFEVGRDGMGDSIGGDEWAFTWEVIASDTTAAGLREVLECIFQTLKPSHTWPQFTYISEA